MARSPRSSLVDAVVRLLPGVLGHELRRQRIASVAGELEAPHYTRPAEFRGWKVPEILLSGNHAEIAWLGEALKRTKQDAGEIGRKAYRAVKVSSRILLIRSAHYIVPKHDAGVDPAETK